MNTCHRTKNKTFILIPFLCIALFGNTSAHANTLTQYKLGVFPFMPMTALIKYFNSVSNDLTRQVNKRVIAQTRSSFKAFSKEIEKETYDIILIQPFDYPLAYEHNYRPLARRGEDLDAILVTKFDSEFRSIKDLAGKTLASPPQESAVSNIIKKDLIAANLYDTSSLKIIYTRNHFACIQMILVKRADACSTTTPVLFNWQNSKLKKDKLRIIHTADVIPHSLYMVHQRVPTKDQEKLKQAFLTWHKRPAGKMILKQFSLNNFVEAKDDEYDVIRNYWK